MQSTVFSELLVMLSQLRARSRFLPQSQEAVKVITVRIPESLATALRKEARERSTSVNKLCIAKLVNTIDGQLVPPE
jgi:predicted HicB family RNase H-like nuclease